MKNSKFKIQNWWQLILLLTSCFLLLASSYASQLKDITVKSAENQDTLTVSVSSKTKFNIFSMSEPSRLVIELSNCEYAITSKITAETSFIKGIRSGQYQDKPRKIARIVVDLKKPVRFSSKSTNNEISITLKEKVITDSSVRKSTETVKPEVAKSTSAVVSKPKPKPKPAPKKKTATPPPTIAKSTETVKPEVAKSTITVVSKPKPKKKSITTIAKSTETVKPAVAKSTITVVSKPKPKKKSTTTIAKSTETVKPAVAAPAPTPTPAPTPAAKPEEIVKPSTAPISIAKVTEPKRVEKVEIKPNIPDKEHLELVKEIKEKGTVPITPTISKKQKAKKPEAKKPTQQTQPTQPTLKSGELPKDLVTLDFTDADIKDVLQVLAVKTGMNIIYSDDVTGTVSLHLENVPFDEAMSLILQMKGFVLQQVGTNILRIMTPATLAKERADAVQVTQIYQLSYAKASDMSAKLTAIMTAENQKITVQTDDRTNSVIVTSTPEGLLRAQTLIKKLDVKPEQVLIEAKIVEIQFETSKDLGIEWNLAKGDIAGGDTSGIGTSDSDSVDYGATEEDKREPSGVGVAAPSASTVGSFTFGYFKSDMLLTARLAAAQAKGNAKVLSQPRVATLNNMEAKIVVGDQIPIPQTTVTTAGATQSTTYITTGIQLTVTPTINADGRITMNVKPEVSYAGGGTPPRISTRNAETTVLVKDGETIVIGGMITDQERNSISQVPLLGDLPVLGSFFKNQHNEKTKTELLVFVTPYIMKE
ncbi:MAG: type IV pilus secretin PilQ [Elusimicrobiota bacterium]